MKKNKSINNKKHRSAYPIIFLMEIMNIITFFHVYDIPTDLKFFGVISGFILLVIITLFTYIFSVSNTIWNFFLTLSIIIQGSVWGLYHKNALILHLFLVIAGLFSSILSDPKTNRQTVFMSFVAYLFFAILIVFKIIDYKHSIVPFIMLVFGVIFIQLQLMFLVNQITNYKKIISGNTESSQSMQLLIERKKQEAEEANKAKSIFLANMSHEIRTPINTILGLGEVILRESTDEKTLNYTKNINNAGKMLLSIVNDILDFSKIENNKMQIIPIEYSITSILDELVTFTKLHAKPKGLTVNTIFSPDLPGILYGDEIRIKQIITNLLTNAVKYTKAGCITFKVDYKELTDDKIILSVEITDTGIGIKEENIPKLFNKFERIDENKNRSIEGTGLGINITENLLNMMGSRLVVKSEFGVGSTFSFELEQKVIDKTPVDTTNRSDKQNAQNFSETFTAEHANILIVDDNEMNLFVAKELLKHTKINITTVTDGKRCLEVTHDKLFDLILMDHMMPYPDGIETLKMLRNDESNICKNIPVIALTANAISGAKEFYLNKGFSDYLTKPVEIKKLEEVLLKNIKKDLITFVTHNNSESLFEYQDEQNKHIDIKTGISYTYNKENYFVLLKMFDEKSSQRYEEITSIVEKCHEDSCKNYVVKVHSLKNTAAMIGAKQLAEIALNLELSGRRNDINCIKKHHDELLTEYKIVETEVKKLLNDEKII